MNSTELIRAGRLSEVRAEAITVESASIFFRSVMRKKGFSNCVM